MTGVVGHPEALGVLDPKAMGRRDMDRPGMDRRRPAGDPEQSTARTSTRSASVCMQGAYSYLGVVFVEVGVRLRVEGAIPSRISPWPRTQSLQRALDARGGARGETPVSPR
jgi:hypothetical protein